MPQKPLADRIKRAKREGKLFPVKESEEEPLQKRSGHSAKKSRSVVRFDPPTDRRASMKAPPRQGRAANRPEKAPEGGSEGAQPLPRWESKTRYVVTVRGRKKLPSEMHIRHQGG